MAKKTHIAAGFAILVAAATGGGVLVGRMTGAQQAEAPKGNPYTPAAPMQAQNPLQPITHAQAAGILTCAAAVVGTARSVIDAPHRATSAWVTGSADDHAFTSIISLSYAAKAAPRAVAVMTATPTPGRGCDTSTVQVHPTARSCALVEADLSKEGRARTEVNGLAAMKGTDGRTYMLLPTAGSEGCVIIAIKNEMTNN